jgi:hypothetical protein
MKTRTSQMCLLASIGAASLVAISATAQTPAPTTTAASTQTAIDPAPVKLPYGVEDVLKLSRAQISEDVTLNFIRNSGTIYNLAPTDIVYLRNQGVSDRVINTMLDQRINVPAEAAAQTAPSSTAAAPQPVVYPDAAQASAQYVPTYVQPAPVYVQPQPDYVPASTLYIIPYSSERYVYPSGYPYSYYGGYYGYGGPSVVYSIGHNSGGRYGGRYGGHYGGNYRGGHYRTYGHH